MSLEPIYDRTAWDHGSAPMPAPCPRCVPGANGVVCLACAGELAARLRDPDDELTVVYYSAHSPALHNWPPDIRGIA